MGDVPGCPSGATPTELGRDTQQLLDIGSMTASLVTLLRAHNPTAVAAFTASLVDINALCALNPDPPQPLSPIDFVLGTSYVGGVPGIDNPAIALYIYEWLRYQAFQQFCVCNITPPTPTNNCLHLTDVFLPRNGTVQLGSGPVTIDPWVYNSWRVGATEFDVGLTIGYTDPEDAGLGGSIWAVQVLGNDGSWHDVMTNGGMRVDPPQDTVITLSAAARFPMTVSMRLRALTTFIDSRINTFDWCFRETPPPPLPIPPQPDLPGLPTVPPPTCSTDDLCAIVQELARQLTRVSGQVADIQASVGGTDQLVTIGTTPISGEGEITLAVGTRAVSVELDVLSDGAFTSALGRPRGLMRVGSVRWGDGNGYSARVFIDADKFTRLRPQGALTLSYQLLPSASGVLRFLG